MLHWCITYLCICEACVNPALSRNSAMRRFKVGDAFKMLNEIIFNFYTGLSCVFLFGCAQIFQPADLLDEKRNFANVLMTLQQLYNIAAGEKCLSAVERGWGGS